MHLFTLVSLAATALTASANPALFPPLLPSFFPAGPTVGSIVSTALAAAPIPSAVAPVVASAVAAVPATPNNASADSIPGLDIPPTELFDNILAAIAILDVVLTLLNSSGLADTQSVKIRDLDLPTSGLTGLLEVGGSLGYTITTVTDLAIPLLSTSVD
ncbi:hypothetical protein HO173_004972 [Letharia columbiana]|uniref:Uncharacterized protein n=1 Tax=Letharia columbiana TaxID=112416 RepID=A0A8H6L5V5_9LECA|nr:uncharacterized protein HO173_004972 [Letharia columbiana]KAF6236681.1 hypothetical protein HO173_004972 [Letharia columbiana]